MTLNAEQLAVVKGCSTAQELIAKAAEAGFQLDEAQAKQLLASDAFAEVDLDDMDAAGGACNSLKDYQYYCDICGKKAAIGPGYHEFQTERDVISVRKACIDCYWKNKDNLEYVWLN